MWGYYGAIKLNPRQNDGPFGRRTNQKWELEPGSERNFDMVSFQKVYHILTVTLSSFHFFPFFLLFVYDFNCQETGKALFRLFKISARNFFQCEQKRQIVV